MSTLLMILLPLAIVLLLAMPIVPVYKGVTTGRKAKHAMIFNLCAFFGVALCAVVLPVADLFALAAPAASEAVAETVSVGAGMGYIAAALVTGLSCIGAGIAVAAAAPAAIGSFSEDSKNFGKSLIFVALGEGVALYGLLISILIINNL